MTTEVRSKPNLQQTHRLTGHYDSQYFASRPLFRH